MGLSVSRRLRRAGQLPLLWIVSLVRACVSALVVCARWLVSIRQELVFFAGVGLLSVGSWWIYPPAGLLVSGALLVWIAIPTRHFPVVFSRGHKETK